MKGETEKPWLFLAQRLAAGDAEFDIFALVSLQYVATTVLTCLLEKKLLFERINVRSNFLRHHKFGATTAAMSGENSHTLPTTFVGTLQKNLLRHSTVSLKLGCCQNSTS